MTRIQDIAQKIKSGYYRFVGIGNHPDENRKTLFVDWTSNEGNDIRIMMVITASEAEYLQKELKDGKENL